MGPSNSCLWYYISLMYQNEYIPLDYCNLVFNLFSHCCRWRVSDPPPFLHQKQIPISHTEFVEYYRPKSKSAPRWRRQTLKLWRWVLLASSAGTDGDALNQQVCYNQHQQQQPARYATEVSPYVASMRFSSRLVAASRKLPPERRHATDAGIEWWPPLSYLSIEFHFFEEKNKLTAKNPANTRNTWKSDSVFYLWSFWTQHCACFQYDFMFLRLTQRPCEPGCSA